MVLGLKNPQNSKERSLMDTIIEKPSIVSGGMSKNMKARVEGILNTKYEPYVDSSVFSTQNIEHELFCPGSDNIPLPPVSWYKPTMEKPEDLGQKKSKAMSKEEERLMFLRYNYAKLRLENLRRSVASKGITQKIARDIMKWHHRVVFHQEYLVNANVALVLAMLKIYRHEFTDFAEMISDGNAALLRSIEKFNVTLGFKFSTYACRSIIKSFSRCCVRAKRQQRRRHVDIQEAFEQTAWHEEQVNMQEGYYLEQMRQIINGNEAKLSASELRVIKLRFGLRREGDHARTLEEVGKLVGVTKERVRQIQNNALSKLRAILTA